MAVFRSGRISVYCFIEKRSETERTALLVNSDYVIQFPVRSYNILLL